METDASPQPLPAPSAHSAAVPPSPRSGAHLQLVVDPPTATAPELDAASPTMAATAAATAPSAAVVIEPDPSEPWSPDRILGLLEAFHASAWGACLTPDAAGGVTAVLMTTERHSFRGVAGLPFLAECLRADGLEGPLGERTTAVLREVPVGLRQFVRFVDRLGAGTLSEITLAKLEYLDRVEPAWQAAVTRHEHARRIDELGLVDQLHELAADVGATLLTDHDLLAGDAEVLFDSIWTERLPDEAVQLHGLDADTAVRVLEISGWCDHYFRSETQVELRNAARRLLERVAQARPAALRRARAQSIAAGLCYAVIHGNVEWLAPRDWLRTACIARQLGVDSSGIPARALALLSAAGVDQPRTAVTTQGGVRRLRLGDPSMLITARRHDIVLHAGWILRQIAAAR